MTQDDTGKTTLAMQGGGFYNRNSGLQAANLTSALPLFEEAARLVPLAGAEPLVLVDYGASQGRNSLPPMRAALQVLRERAGADRPVEVIHTDLPTNDFAALFTMLQEDPGSYTATDRNVFGLAIGRSFYEAVLPPDSVHLGWSSNALHWMSRNPMQVQDHGWAILSASAAARAAVDQQQAEDWRNFLLARSTELRSGGRLVCQFMGRGQDSHGFDWMSNNFWDCVAEMAADGLLTAEELLRMTSPSAGRSMEQLHDPFAGGRFAGLALEYAVTVEAPDPYWAIYQQTGDAQQLGHAWASMMRAVHAPLVVNALAPDRPQAVILDDLFTRLAARVAATPQRSRSYNIIVVIAK